MIAVLFCAREVTMDTEKQTVTLSDWQTLNINGVEDIAGFDEGIVILETHSGRISVEGVGLKIESLTRDGGVVFIRGGISGIYRSEKEKKRGFFGRN